MTRLQVESLTFIDRGPFSLTLAASGCASLTGDSGAGKTLLLRAIADLILHDGRILLDGRELTTFSGPEWRRQVGLLPSESRWWRKTVGEHFNQENLPKIMPWLEKLGFGGPAAAQKILSWRISRLSSGERQRLALVRLLANQPKVLLLDEPTSNLDISNTARVEDLIRDYLDTTEAAVLWVCHDPSQAKRVAKNHLRLHNGAILEEPLP